METCRNGERATTAVIDLDAVSYNVSGIRKKIGKMRELMAVVKADGYGHGSVQVSMAALRSGANSLAVALPEEGQLLRAEGIDAPILVLGLIQPEESYKIIRSRLDQTLCSLELAEALDQEARKASVRVNVHIKIDTGMGRIGLCPEDVPSFLQKIRQFRNLDVVGIFSHFSSADQADKSVSNKQIAVFDRVVREIELAGFRIPKKHMANSAAVLDLPLSYYDLVRPGIMIYGLYPSREVGRNVELRPAMTLKTRISFVKRSPPGTPISYGGAFVTHKETTVATLPVGYGDGYSRLLTEHGQVLIKGRRVPVIGRICMDMCMVDVSRIGGIKPGEEVILFGDNLPVDDVAEKIGTISYEIVCSVDKRVPRVYVEGGRGIGDHGKRQEC
jgi:alanine racemase